MANESHPGSPAIQRAASGLGLVLLVTGGVVALLYFFRQILMPGELGSLSLPIVAITAGLAATFNPCGLPALPGFITFMGGGGEDLKPGRRSLLSGATSLGAITLVMAIGLIVAIAGSGTKDLIAPYFRWVQLGVGLFLIAIAGVHLAGQTSRLPLIGTVMGLGGRVWEGTIGKPTPRSCYAFGAGYVLVGVG